LAADPKQIKKRFDSLKSRRANLEEHCEDVARYVLPNNVGFTGTQTPYQKRMGKIVDATGVDGCGLCAAGLHGIATPDSKRWFGLRVPGMSTDENEGLKDWLADAADVMYEEMYAPDTNLVASLSEAYLELVAFGTAVIFTGEQDEGGLLYQARPLRESFISENHQGKVDTVYRKYQMTVRQVEQQWPGKCSEKTRKKIDDGKLDDPCEIIHAVEPRMDRERGKKNALNHPFKSVYIEADCDHLLDESGFPEFPYAVFRWLKLPGEEYGYSPAMTTLADIKMLNEMGTTIIKAAQKSADPPLQIPDDGVVGPVRTTPGGFIYVRGENRIEPLVTGANFPVTLEMQQRLQTAILRRFYADLFQMPEDVNMTATEYMQRVTERLRLLGPVAGRLISALGDLIGRTASILARAGKLPPAPPEIADPKRKGQSKRFSVEFVSPIAMAQKQTEANSFVSTAQTLGMMAQAEGDPVAAKEYFKVFKKADIGRKVFEINGGDPDLTLTSDEIAALDQAEQQQAQAAQAAMMAEQAAKAANQGAGAIDKAASAQQKGADLSVITGGMGG
jgi:hypothetical protein